MLRLQRGRPIMYISIPDAKDRGIADGEEVEVRNDIDSFRIHAKLSPSLRPGQLIIYHAWEEVYHDSRGTRRFPERSSEGPIDQSRLALELAGEGEATCGRSRFVCSRARTTAIRGWKWHGSRSEQGGLRHSTNPPEWRLGNRPACARAAALGPRESTSNSRTRHVPIGFGKGAWATPRTRDFFFKFLFFLLLHSKTFFSRKQTSAERDICTKFITPAVKRAGWDEMSQIREEVSFTKGRIIVRGKLVTRGKAKRADYVLYYKPNIPIALIEAKDNNHSVGDGMQQGLDYAATLDIPFVFLLERRRLRVPRPHRPERHE